MILVNAILMRSLAILSLNFMAFVMRRRVFGVCSNALQKFNPHFCQAPYAPHAPHSETGRAKSSGSTGTHPVAGTNLRFKPLKSLPRKPIKILDIASDMLGAVFLYLVLMTDRAPGFRVVALGALGYQ